jgi:AcrR family transcriptional regulator
MATQVHHDAPAREPLSRKRVLRVAVELADRDGIDGLTMRTLAQELGVVPMALYKHVANKDEMLAGMLDVVVGQIELPEPGADWKTAVRERILSARRALLRHPWAYHVLDTSGTPTPAVVTYMDGMIGLFRAGGFSMDLTHHAMHALGSRLLGYTHEMMNDTAELDPETEAALYAAMAETHPNIAELIRTVAHDDATVVGPGCDDQFEFEFALDLLLDGLERLRGEA